jgi:hypothetical protein
MTLKPLLGACSLVLGLGLPAGALAQDAGAGVPKAPAADTSSVNVDRLPLDLQRIERQLRQSPSEREEHDGLQLRYFIDVYGKSPRVELFAPDTDLKFGPTPYGAPTHKDMLQQVTPKEFSAPVMDFNGLVRWFSDKLGK